MGSLSFDENAGFAPTTQVTSFPNRCSDCGVALVGFSGFGCMTCPRVIVGRKSGDMRVLLVDDEASVRKIVATMLRAHRYEVIEAASGPEALQLAKANAVDLVVTDLMMPEMDGESLIIALREQGCKARYLLISGYGDRTIPEIPMLAKPFTAKQLLHAIDVVTASQPPRDVDQLHEKMAEARAEWKAAVADMDAVLLERGSVPYPDSSVRIQQARQKQAAAYKRYRAAIHDYVAAVRASGQLDAVSGEIEPED